MRYRTGRIVQIDVKAHKVAAGRLQELGRGEVAEAGETLRGLLLRKVEQLVEESLDAAAAIEADDIGGQLVGN